MRWLSLLLLSSVAWAATPLHGVVRSGGVPVPGAVVTASQAGKTETAITGDDGAYGFADLADGTWTVSVAMTGFEPASRPVALSSATPPQDFDLRIAAYTGPAVVPTPAAATGFTRTQLGRSGKPSAPPAAATTPPAAPAGAAPEISGGDANRTAADSLAVNGSIDNGAASPFAQSPAFGNFRRNGRGLYNGGFGFTLGNSALDARTFSITGQNTPRPNFSNLTGNASFGGPVVIPHLVNVNDNLFLFVAYQKTTNTTATNTPALMPTAAERAGDLTALGGPVLQPGQISPQAQALLALYPAPNLANDPRFNYQAALIGATHQDGLRIRINKPISRGNQLAIQLGLQSTRADAPNLFGYVDRQDSLGQNDTVNWTHSFSPRLYGTFGVQFSRLGAQAEPFFANRTNISGDAGIAGNNQSPLYWGPPSLSFSSGFASLSDGNPSHNRNQTAAFSYSGYWNHYDHNLTFGGDLRRLELNFLQQANPRGSFTFNGSASGNDFEDFLLGTPDAESLAFGNADKYFREGTYDLFFTDDWRASSSLTLNLGVRWEYSAPITERYNRLVNLDIAPGFTAAAPVLASNPVGAVSGAAYPNSLLAPDKHGFEPRLGLAWRPLAASSLLIKAGYGIYDDTSVYQNIALQMAQQSPLAVSLSLANTPATPLTMAQGFTLTPPSTPDLFAIDPHFRVGYAQSWNASLQRDLPMALVMTASYLGTKGTRAVQEYYPNSVAPGAANPCPTCPVGFLYMASNGNSSYESGTFQLQRRFHNGIAGTLNYTYAHAIDDAAVGGKNSSGAVVAQNWLDLDAERGRSSFDQRHLLTATAQYSTGVGVKGGALLSGWKGALYKGWTLTTQITAGSGLPLTPTTFGVLTGTGFTGVRPELTGQPLYTGAGLLNPAAFTTPAPGTFGNAGRDSLNGPSQFGLNASMQRSFQVTDRITANLRLDATNALNHVAFPSWDTLVGSTQFGLPLSANPMRSLTSTLGFTF